MNKYKLFNKTSELIVLQSDKKTSITLFPQKWAEITEDFLASSHYMKLRDKNKVQLYIEEVVIPPILSEVVEHNEPESLPTLAEEVKDIMIEDSKRSKKKN